MPLPGVCPSCGVQFDLAQALTDAEARQALAAALELPAPLARLIVPYIGLHSPQGRRIAWRKLARLLRELTEQIGSAQVSRNGITHAAPLPLWKAGLEAVLAANDSGSLTLPLEGHGYLCKVVWSEAAKAAGRAERKQDERRPLHPSHRVIDGEARSGNGSRRESLGELAALRRLYEHAPNDALKDKIEALERRLNGEK